MEKIFRIRVYLIFHFYIHYIICHIQYIIYYYRMYMTTCGLGIN